MMNKQFKYRCFLLEPPPTSAYPGSCLVCVVVSCLTVSTLVDLNLNNTTVEPVGLIRETHPIGRESVGQNVSSGQIHQPSWVVALTPLCRMLNGFTVSTRMVLTNTLTKLSNSIKTNKNTIYKYN